jgi:WD40 repeat protein
MKHLISVDYKIFLYDTNSGECIYELSSDHLFLNSGDYIVTGEDFYLITSKTIDHFDKKIYIFANIDD